MKINIYLFIVTLIYFSQVNAQQEKPSPQNPSTQRQAELHNLLIQDCGSCHGMTMKGGLGPALTPDVLKSKPRKMIEVTIANGRAGTPMPPWNKILTSEEITWMVDTLYAGVKQQ